MVPGFRVMRIARPQVADEGCDLRVWSVAGTTSNSHPEPSKRGPPHWGLGQERATHRKEPACDEMSSCVLDMERRIPTNDLNKLKCS